MLYKAMDVHNREIYTAKNIAELKLIVEAHVIITDTLPQGYSTTWSPSRCITWLVQAGYIIPYAGPDWFLALNTHDDDESSSRPRMVRPRAQFITDDGTLDLDGNVNVTHWKDRNHVRLTFRTRDEIYGEVFITEESVRNLWIGLGRLIGFNQEDLETIVEQLPKPQVFTPHIPPQRTRQDATSQDESADDAFDIFRAINELDLNLDDLDPESGE